MPLTDVQIRSLKPRSKSYRVGDSGWLLLEVRPTGKKAWRLKYRHANKENMISLGDYPQVSLSEARRKRDEQKEILRAGKDLSQTKKAAKAAAQQQSSNTFAAIVEEWFAENAHALTPGTVKRDMRLFRRDLAPYIGQRPIAEIEAPELLSVLKRIQARGVLETAHRARSMASKFFRYAVATGRAKSDPAAVLVRALPSAKTKHFPSLTEPAQVGELLRAIYGYQGQPVTQAGLKLLALTFVRPGELRAAKWSDINLDSAEWRYTATKTKTPHIVPLSRQALETVRELLPLTGQGTFVFPSVRSRQRPISENTINGGLRRLGFDNATMTGHGFRATARTMLDEQLKYPIHIIEQQLAHAVRDVNGRAYNRTAHLEDRKAMMQAWADYLDCLRLSPLVAN